MYAFSHNYNFLLCYNDILASNTEDTINVL